MLGLLLLDRVVVPAKAATMSLAELATKAKLAIDSFRFKDRLRAGLRETEDDEDKRFIVIFSVCANVLEVHGCSFVTVDLSTNNDYFPKVKLLFLLFVVTDCPQQQHYP